MSDYSIYLIGGEDDEEAKFTTEERDELCYITIKYRNQVIEAGAEDYFEALCQIRLKLEPERLIPFCYGASLNVFPSDMSRSMGSGQSAYRLTPGHPALTKDLVKIFDSGHDVVPASVVSQEQYYKDWIQSLNS